MLSKKLSKKHIPIFEARMLSLFRHERHLSFCFLSCRWGHLDIRFFTWKEPFEWRE